MLADWFDREVWRRIGQGEYRQPIDPVALLAPAPEEIWPGLMGCDLLPLLSNTVGDWLCARVDGHNQVAEVIQWYHGGGDWIIWGSNLAEAIVFDAISDRLPGPSRRHAVPAESPRPIQPSDEDPILNWALEHMPPSVVGLFESQRQDSDSVAEILIDEGVAEVAVRCELVQHALSPSLPFSADLSRKLGIPPCELAQWSFDSHRIPKDKRKLIEQVGACHLLQEHDWADAEAHALRVTELAPQIAWGWEIAGYAAHRRGDLQLAKTRYLQASQCSIFSDQSIRLQTHWTAHHAAKFSVARLAELFPELVAASAYLNRLCEPAPTRRGERTTAYWTEQASMRIAAGNPAQAYHCLVAAGWDIGAQPITAFADLLDQISDTADLAGQFARGEVARTHRVCLRDRYRI